MLASRLRHRVGLIVAAVIIGWMTAGCGASGAASSVSATAGASSTAPSGAPSAPASAGSGSPGLHLVGLGDSVAGAGHCGGCRSYVLALGDLASTALGKPVEATNLARNDGLTSSRLTSYVKQDDAVRQALAAADIITIGIGWNDWQGPCSWKGHAACLANGQAAVEKNLTRTLEAINELRAGRPTAIRVVAYADEYRGNPEAPGAWGFPDTPEDIATFEAAFATALTAFNSMLCDVAAANGATCVDLVPAFNGPSGTEPFAPELRGSQAQQDLIAATIDKAGYAPLP